jgi:hypothetical protein
MALPQDWALVGTEHRRSPASWPIAYLEELAHYPHVHGTHFDVGHTFGVADPHDAYIEGTSYAGAILAEPRFRPATFDHVITAQGGVQFLMPIPIFEVELDYKHLHGGEALIECLLAESPEAFGPLDLGRMPAA